MRYMVTHSLLASWLYAMKENPYETAGSEKDAYADFLSVLNRIPTPRTEAMQKGIDFEDLVTNILYGSADRSNKWWEAAANIANQIRGGKLQLVAKKDIVVDNIDVLLYGRLDSLYAGTIYDIKFSGSYDRGKYIDGTQHPVYLELVPEAKRFVYLISDGTNLWSEVYRRDETAPIVPIIHNFFTFLRNAGLFEIYKDKWRAA